MGFGWLLEIASAIHPALGLALLGAALMAVGGLCHLGVRLLRREHQPD